MGPIFPNKRIAVTFVTTIIAATVAILLVLLLEGCGFHLRGDIELPPEINQLALEDSATGSEIMPVILLQLRRNGIKPISNPEQAALILVVEGEKYKRRVLTVSSAGQVQEFELSYNIAYSIKNVKDADASLLRQNVSIKRDLRFNANEVLGKASEETRLKKDMIYSASEQILQRLSSAVSKGQITEIQ